MTELNWDVWKSVDRVQVNSDDYVAFDSHLTKYFQLLMDFDFGQVDWLVGVSLCEGGKLDWCVFVRGTTLMSEKSLTRSENNILMKIMTRG